MRFFTICSVLHLVTLISANSLTNIPLEFEYLTQDDGLSSNLVTCIYKDSKGFMWFGTRNGLNRYDAYEFNVWKHIPGDSTGLPDIHISDIVEDEIGNIWIGTNNGLAVYNYSTNKIKQIVTPVQQNHHPVASLIRKMVVLDSVLWIADAKGLFRFDPTKNRSPIFLDFFNGEAYPVRAITSHEANNEIWFSDYQKGLFKYSVSKNKLNKIDIREMDNAFADVLVFKNKDTLLIGTNAKGVLEYSLNTGKVQTYFSQLSKNDINRNIYAIEKYGKNSFWVSQGHSLYLCDGELNIIEEYKNGKNEYNSLFQGIIYDIFSDKNNINWFANSPFGIRVYNKNTKPLGQYYVSTGERGSNKSYVRCVTIDSMQRKWVGTFGNGLITFSEDNEVLKYYTVSNSNLRSNIIFDIEIINNYEYWIATTDGISIFDPINNTWIRNLTTENNLWHNEVRALLYANNSIWIASKEGLNRYDTDEQRMLKIGLNEGFSQDIFTGFQKDRLNNIWIATNDGVSRYNSADGTFTHFKPSKRESRGLSNDYVYCIYPDTGGIVWIGTANGLNKYDYSTNSFSWYFEKDGLENNIINKIVIDNKSRLCILSPSGVSIVNREIQRLSYYNKLDGLSANLNVLELTKENKLVLGDKNVGYYEFNIDSISINKNPPPVYITGVHTLSGKSAKNGMVQPLVFGYSDRNIKIKYTALDYFSPTKNRYAYKLEGLHDKWLYTSSAQREVTFYNLSSGEYTFKVNASNNNNVWNEKGDQVNIVILPPWWLTWWMFTFYLLFIVMVVSITVMLRIKRVRLFEAVRLAKVKQESDEMKLRYFTDVSHEFRTPLTLIVNPVEKLASHPAIPSELSEEITIIQKNVSRLRLLIDQFLEYRKHSVGKLKNDPRNVELIAFIESVYALFVPVCREKEIDYSFICGREQLKCKVDTNLLDKILYNLLSNAFKNTPIKGKIKLELFFNKNQKEKDLDKKNYLGTITLHVINTGKGISPEYINNVFERFFQLPDENKSAGSGIGLSIVKEYTELIGGVVRAKSIPYEETVFSIDIPVMDTADSDTEDITTKYKSQHIEYEITGNEIKSNGLYGSDENKIMLIVDDNKEIRELLKRIFKYDYLVLEAVNGKEAIEKAVGNIPDIIISDVMMPVIDGIKFCAKIKQLDHTAHIPVVLLTAKSGEEAETIGIETGADDYITKPFSEKLLIAKTNSLLKNREKLKQIYQDRHFSDLSEVSNNKTDSSFLEKINGICKHNINKETFNVDVLAVELNMSTSQLHRKFKGMLGTSPGDFLRMYRLNMALELIKKTKMSISEIAFAVGYKYSNHFSRSFQKQFGSPPSDFRQI